MAYLNYNGKIIKFGNNILNSGETFNFKFSGVSFPEILSEDGFGMIILRFSTAEKVVINYGNGVIIEYQSIYVSLGVYEIIFRKAGGNTTVTNINNYNFPDVTILPRVVSISFNRSKLTVFQIFTLKLDIGDFLFEFVKYSNLRTFDVQQLQTIVGLNLEGNLLQTQLNEVFINSAFHITSPYFSSIPSTLLNLPLKSLGVGGGGYTSDFTTTKLDQIYLLAGTLEYLKLQNIPITFLPNNFFLLSILKRLELFSTQITTIPDEINTIPSIKILGVGFNTLIASWGDISNLINLEELNVANTPLLSNSIPSYFNSFQLLKIVNRSGSLKTTTDADAWVNNWYDFTVTNTPISGSNTLQFRGMNHNISNQTLNDGVVAPSGIYQQPIDFVIGIDNGTPATPKEKIWVMVNQYGHVWTTL